MKVSERVEKIFFHHGLFCATHPILTIASTICIFLFFCYPMRKLSLSRDVPFEAIPLPESKVRSILSTSSMQKISSDDYNYTAVVQVIFRSSISPQRSDTSYLDALRLNLNASFQIHDIVRTTKFTSSQKSDFYKHLGFESICMRMKAFSKNTDLKNNAEKPSKSRILGIPTPTLPVEDCAILSPSLIWGNEFSLFQIDDLELLERLSLSEIQEMVGVLFGLPQSLIGMPMGRFQRIPEMNAFATTIVFRDFYPEYIHRLRERLHAAFPDSEPLGSDHDLKEEEEEEEEAQAFVVHYRGHSFLVQYAPVIAIYTGLILYVCFSLGKIDMVKSKFGLSVSACCTICASFMMTLSLCFALDLTAPVLRGREFFPYLVVLIGFENIMLITKSIVGTPIDLPVKHRVAQGLAREGWYLMKNLLYAFACMSVGFLTFDSGITEFCLIATISLTTDFFLQLFFFVPVLAIDIRRMEVSELQRYSIPLSDPLLHHQDGSLPSGNCIHRDSSSELPEYHRRSMSPTPLNCQNGFYPGHRRARSDATAAAFVTEKITPVPLKRRLLAYLRKRATFRHIGLLIMAVWLLVLLCYALLPHPEPLPNLSPSPSPPTPPRETPSTSTIKTAEPRSPRVRFRGPTWDAESLWRHLAFDMWPAVAKLYNFSLSGRRLVVFQPIHVTKRFSPEEAITSRPSSYHIPAVKDATDQSEAEESGDDCDDEGWWWSHMLSGQKEALAVLGGLRWRGLLDWTARLWDTARLAAASILGAGCILSVTCAFMLLVHHRLSRSNPNSFRVPVVRVGQCEVPLLKGPSHSIEEWVVAVDGGGVETAVCDPLSRHRSASGCLVAAAVSGFFGAPALVRGIQVWSARCGHRLGIIDRFYEEGTSVRRGASCHRDLSQRISPVWAMKMLSTANSLVVGCANATLEIWDLESFTLRQLIDLTSPEAFYDPEGRVIDRGGRPVFVGGVTVIETPLESQRSFYFGTSLGFVGYVKWVPLPPDGCWRVSAKWMAHGPQHGLVLLAPQRVFPPLHRHSFDLRSHRFRHASGEREDEAFISGSLGGCLALIQPRFLRFQRLTWPDASNVLAVDFLQSTVVVGQSSGAVWMLSVPPSLPFVVESSGELQVRAEPTRLCSVGDADGGVAWVRLFKTASSGASGEVFRMVTYSQTGSVAIWSVRNPSSCQILRQFPANAPSFVLRAPIICAEERIIFGERGYLRVVNPRTAKYERSVHLMPPSLRHFFAAGGSGLGGSQSELDAAWECGLGPLGIVGGVAPPNRSREPQQFLCGLSDSGRSLFIVPKSVVLN